MIIQIEALDTLFFRDGKPFEMGDDTWASGIFPPPPSVFYGALRSAYFAENMSEFGKANTKDDPTNKLKVNGIYIGNETMSFFPIPLEIVEEKGAMNQECLFEYNSVVDVFYSSSLINNILQYHTEVENPEGLLEKSELNKYIEEKFDKLSYWEIQKLINKENKIGIARNNETNISDEGRLYRVAMNRLFAIGGNNPLYFLIDANFEELGFQPKTLKLGGEGKVSKCIEYKRSIKIKEPEIDNYFKLCFLTASIFENSPNKNDGGWLPKEFIFDNQEKAFVGIWKGIKLKLIRAFVGTPQLIGGFDIQKREPKKMYRTIPSGSVYHFEVLDYINSQNIIDIFHQKTISDLYSEQGFGLTIVAKLSNK